MTELSRKCGQERLDDMVDLLAGGGSDRQSGYEIKRLQPKSRKAIGLASGGAIGSVIPGVGSLLGAIIGYSLADSPWVANKVEQWLGR